MGTRADFYAGVVKGEWLGSIAWDGYPSGLPDTIKLAPTEDAYREAVGVFLASRDDATLPAMGWPWPWNDSATTDYAYAFVAGENGEPHGTVMASYFGNAWIFVPREGDGPWDEWPTDPKPIFPDMSTRKRVTLGRRSGVVVMRSTGVGQPPEVIG